MTPSLDGRCASNLMTLETGWGDAGNINLLCALELSEPCATFRPNEAQLKPPQQLRFVFRQERRTRAAWAFPSAQEQAALHA